MMKKPKIFKFTIYNLDMDYMKLGFKCGLEIHKQLAGKKLFCNCNAINSDKEQDIEIRRNLRAVAGELGEIDIAAKHEMEKGKEFIYLASLDYVCNIEFDDAPPHQ